MFWKAVTKQSKVLRPLTIIDVLLIYKSLRLYNEQRDKSAMKCYTNI